MVRLFRELLRPYHEVLVIVLVSMLVTTAMGLAARYEDAVAILGLKGAHTKAQHPK